MSKIRLDSLYGMTVNHSSMSESVSRVPFSLGEVGPSDTGIYV